MDSEILNSEIETLKNENKLLKGKIRGYQTLNQLFQEEKRKNQSLQLQQQSKEMVSIGTEINYPSLKNESSQMSASQTEINLVPKPAEDYGARIKVAPPMNPLEYSLPIESTDEREVTLRLRTQLEEALQSIGDMERKRSSEKVLIKVLNDQVKKTKDELLSYKELLEKTRREKELVMKKVAMLEQQRDNIPQNAGIALKPTREMEGAEDWVHLQQEMETEEADDKDYEIQQLKYKCHELQEKASRWENEHFNLQMEYTKHVNDLRLLLQSKSKELVQVTESLTSDKKALEAKFQALEVLLKKEKAAKLESYNLHQETMRKYKSLEKKFLALEEKNKDPVLKVANPNPFPKVNQASHAVSTSNVLGLQQQVNLFKVDFEKEKKERIFAEKRSREFEEKLRYLSKQLEKKEKQIEYERKRMKPVNPTNEMKTPKMPACWACECCTFINDPQVEECKICRAPKTSQKGLSGWKCSNCEFTNIHGTSCSICNVERTRTANVGYDPYDDLAIDGPEADPPLKTS